MLKRDEMYSRVDLVGKQTQFVVAVKCDADDEMERCHGTGQRRRQHASAYVRTIHQLTRPHANVALHVHCT